MQLKGSLLLSSSTTAVRCSPRFAHDKKVLLERILSEASDLPGISGGGLARDTRRRSPLPTLNRNTSVVLVSRRLAVFLRDGGEPFDQDESP